MTPNEPDEFVPGRAVEVAPGVRRLLAPNPGRMTGPGTNTYLVGRSQVVVLDPGPAIEAHLDALRLAVGRARVVAIAVTHAHRDHSPAAMRLRDAFPAPCVGRPARHPEFHDPTFVPDSIAGDGHRLETDAGDLVAIATPGHASDHLCWHLPAARLLFTGDHVLGTVSPVILPPDGDMTEYLDSLARLRSVGALRLAPGHGPLLDDPAATVEALIRHRLARESIVVEMLRRHGPASTDALLPFVYRDVDAALHGYARYSLVAHLEKLERDGRARRDGEDWRPA